MTSSPPPIIKSMFFRSLETLTCISIFLFFFPYSFEITNIYIIVRIFFYRYRLPVTGECAPKSRLVLSLPALMSVAVYVALQIDDGILSETIYASVCKTSISFDAEFYKKSLLSHKNQVNYFSIIFSSMVCPYFFVTLLMPNYLSLFREKSDHRKIPNLKEVAFIMATIAISCVLTIDAYHDNAQYADMSSIHPIVDAAFGFKRGSNTYTIINIIFWSKVIMVMPILQYAALTSVFLRLTANRRGE